MLNDKIQVALIVATAARGVIGRENQLPWHLPQDLKYFKATTLGKPVIMGRKTYESIGRPLPGRPNIVVTRNLAWSAAGVLAAANVDDALAGARQLIAENSGLKPEVMVIGGAEIYRSALPLADRIYLTEIDLDIQGDAYFPSLPPGQWRLVSEVEGEVGAIISHRFKVFEKIK